MTSLPSGDSWRHKIGYDRIMSETPVYPVIKNTSNDLDMGPWLAEKTDALLAALARHADFLRNLPDDSNPSPQELLKSVSGCAGYATKVYALAVGAQWEFDDAGMIIRDGVKGYLNLTRAYGTFGHFSGSMSEARREANLADFRTRVHKLLDGPETPNRTLLHELIMGFEYSHLSSVDAIAEKLETVTHNEMKWSQFIEEARELVESCI